LASLLLTLLVIQTSLVLVLTALALKFALLLIVSPLIVSLPPLPFPLSLLIGVPASTSRVVSVLRWRDAALHCADFLVALPLKFVVTALLLLLTLLVRLPLSFGPFLFLPLTTRLFSLPALLLRLLIVTSLFLGLVVIATLVVPLATFFPTFLSLLAPRILSLIAVTRILRLGKAGKAEGCTDTETQSYQNGSQVTGFHIGPPCVN